MRLVFFILFLPVIIVATGLNTAAQGSFGDPIYTFDFGTGSNPGPPLGLNPAGTNYTNMTYTTGCPDDGSYTIVNSLNSTNNCHENTWIDIPTDHTGNLNGYMMLINASFTPSIFFTAPLPTKVVLCQNTIYQFSAYIANLISQAAGAGTIDPDITFTVTAPDGTILATHNTGDIPPSPANTSPWHQYLVQFNTMGYSTVTVTMTNNADGGNGNDLMLDDISFSAYGPTLATPQFDVVSGPPTLCQGDGTTYKLSTAIPPGAYPDPAEQWQQNINNGGWVDMPGQTQPILNLNTQFEPANTPGTFQYRMAFADADNISSPNCRVYTSPVIITVNPGVTAIVSSPEQSECQGDPLTLTASGGTTYQWTGPNMQPSTQNPLIISSLSAANAGTYTVMAFSQYGCPSLPVQTKVIVFPKAEAVATGGTTICEGLSTPLSASGGITYAWSPGTSLSDSTIANPFASPIDNTTYKVIVTDANGCQDSAKVSVSVLKAPIAHAGPKIYLFEGQSTVINAKAEYESSVYWTPTTGLSDPNILNPVASPKSDIKYTLHINSALGCGTDTSSVYVRVYEHITIPNTFSPNNDGINDLWNIDALITYPESLMMIFDRYGQQVYKSVGYSKPWDGTYDGKPVPPGTYYYVLDLKNNTPKIAGYVMVVR